MGFRHFPNILNKLRKLKTYVECKLVFSDGSLMVHFAKLLAAQIWWTGCRDDVIPPDELVILFPHHSINYRLKLVNEIYMMIVKMMAYSMTLKEESLNFL